MRDNSDVVPNDKITELTKEKNGYEQRYAVMYPQLVSYSKEGDFKRIEEIFNEYFLHDEKENVIWSRNPQTGRNLVHEICGSGHLSILKYYLSFSVNTLEIKTMMGGATALHIATEYSHRPLVFFLLTNGASPRCVDKFSSTPLHYCSSKTIAKLLIKYDVPISSRNKWKKTPYETIYERYKGTEDVQIIELLKYLRIEEETNYKKTLHEYRMRRKENV